jgi:hypothetical protein
VGQELLALAGPYAGNAYERRPLQTKSDGKLLGDCVSALARHLDVQDTNIGLVTLHRFQDAVAAVDLMNRVTFVDEDQQQGLNRVAVVVRDQPCRT